MLCGPTFTTVIWYEFGSIDPYQLLVCDALDRLTAILAYVRKDVD